ncbi:MAG: membrane lipoprotein lipid attachment site-containing protein [Bacilli bacterium]|nr:membrane lipoprotein lipid attachment site-containing protein [Bacilli bacterium]MDD3305257.1 membrane lipoprotein lipid attachment site-containing protein [Bacilli bacterium]MDD4053947.1 membrane lipoprotein lipid attachment site-containing protein [Bacilli bacterium]MDD4411207.1 membrane lipoprotein lipid attachment site-containing protein [Bacilli bacterium]
MKKILCLVSLLLIVTGCSNSQFEPNYNKMEVSDKGINGYSLYLSVSGKVGEDSINQIIKIDNYKDQEYKIEKPDNEIPEVREEDKEEIKEEDVDTNKNVFYVLNNKLYIAGEDGKYVEDTKNTKYNNPAIYLDGLKTVTNVSEPKEKASGETEYDVTFSKKTAEKILKDLELKGLTLSDDIKGQIILNKDGYVKNIIYNIGDIRINAIYYRVNEATEIFFPAEIEPNRK